jgi:hypothetical protein
MLGFLEFFPAFETGFDRMRLNRKGKATTLSCVLQFREPARSLLVKRRFKSKQSGDAIRPSPIGSFLLCHPLLVSYNVRHQRVRRRSASLLSSTDSHPHTL